MRLLAYVSILADFTCALRMSRVIWVSKLYSKSGGDRPV